MLAPLRFRGDDNDYAGKRGSDPRFRGDDNDYAGERVAIPASAGMTMITLAKG
jgi:hypothetical protein